MAAKLVQVKESSEAACFPSGEGMPAFDNTLIDAHQSDAHLMVIANNRVQARCSLWWNSTPKIEECLKVGLIGHYSACDNISADKLLKFACQQLSDQGASVAVGPVDQNTWRTYRFATEGEGEPPFLFEPFHPRESPLQFARNGFKSCARYFSAMVSDLSCRSPRLEIVERRLTERNIIVRNICESNFIRDLEGIYDVARLAFAGNFLYQKIPRRSFVQQYRELRQRIPLNLVFVAEQNRRIVGFCFAIPDMCEAERGEPARTVIIKTLAVLPGHQFAGLGYVLLERAQQQASKLGFHRGIHALVRDRTNLRKISQTYATPFRRYDLFSRVLQR